ncbi:hypothetical protein PALA111701_28045 [Paenibacillus lactis]
MNSTVEIIEGEDNYWPEYIFGFWADDDYEGDDINNAKL